MFTSLLRDYVSLPSFNSQTPITVNHPLPTHPPVSPPSPILPRIPVVECPWPLSRTGLDTKRCTHEGRKAHGRCGVWGDAVEQAHNPDQLLDPGYVSAKFFLLCGWPVPEGGHVVQSSDDHCARMPTGHWHRVERGTVSKPLATVLPLLCAVRLNHSRCRH